MPVAGTSHTGSSDVSVVKLFSFVVFAADEKLVCFPPAIFKKDYRDGPHYDGLHYELAPYSKTLARDKTI